MLFRTLCVVRTLPILVRTSTPTVPVDVTSRGAQEHPSSSFCNISPGWKETLQKREIFRGYTPETMLQSYLPRRRLKKKGLTCYSIFSKTIHTNPLHLHWFFFVPHHHTIFGIGSESILLCLYYLSFPPISLLNLRTFNDIRAF